MAEEGKTKPEAQNELFSWRGRRESGNEGHDVARTQTANTW